MVSKSTTEPGFTLLELLVAIAVISLLASIAIAKYMRRWGQLVYLGREWSRMSAKELGRQIHRDASVISRLFGRYARNRDLSVEAKLAQVLER